MELTDEEAATIAKAVNMAAGFIASSCGWSEDSFEDWYNDQLPRSDVRLPNTLVTLCDAIQILKAHDVA